MESSEKDKAVRLQYGKHCEAWTITSRLSKAFKGSEWLLHQAAKDCIQCALESAYVKQ